MAGDDTQGSGPDLELPSLFRRRRKDRTPPGGTGADATETPSGSTSAKPAEEPAEELPATAQPVAGEETQPLRPVPGATRRPPSAPPPTAPSAREPGTRPEPQPEPQPGPPPPADETPARPPKPTGPPPRPRRRGPDMTWSEGPSPAEPAVAAAGPVALAEDHAAGPTDERPAAGPEHEPGQEPGQEPAAASRRLPRPTLPSLTLSLPRLAPRLAAAVTGVAVATTGILLVWLSLQACSSVRGVSSCGGVGLLAIVLTLVAQGAVGTLLLGLLGVTAARSTAVLGVGVTSFVAMVLLYASVSGPWLSAALLVVTPAAFVLAEGVTGGRFADTS